MHRALTKLAGEGLLCAIAERGYVVTPITVGTSDATLDARCAVELGAAELTVGRFGGGLAELRRLMEDTLPLIDADRFVDVGQLRAREPGFHEFHVSLAKSQPAFATPTRG